ncbi:hypothetical protein ScPMuIL_000479 [Solemya velum]
MLPYIVTSEDNLKNDEGGFLCDLPIHFPIIIIIDGLDYADDFVSFGMSWLPRTLPPGVKLILTISNSECMKPFVKEDNLWKIDSLERNDAEELLSLEISVHSRPMQIPIASEGCRLPFYMTVLSCILSLWRNSCGVSPPTELPTTVTALLLHLLDILENIHGYERILHVLGILISVKYGICDRFMCEILSSIIGVQMRFDSSKLFWCTVKTQLSFLLGKSIWKGHMIYRLSHPAVTSVITKRYFSSETSLSPIHDKILAFFHKIEEENTTNSEDNNPASGYICCCLNNLPFHELLSSQSSLFLKSKLFNFKWICAVLSDVGVYHLLSVLEMVSLTNPERKDFGILFKVIASSANALHINHKEFVSQMCSRIRYTAHPKNNPNFRKLLESSRNSQYPMLLVSDNCTFNTNWSQTEENAPPTLVDHLTYLCKVKNNPKHIISLSKYQGRIIVWNMECREKVRVLEGVKLPLQIKMLDSLRAVALCDRELLVYNLDTGKHQTTIKGLLNIQLPLYEVQNEYNIVSLSRNRMCLYLMDASSGNSVASFKVGEDRFISSLYVSGNGKVLVCSEDVDKTHPILVWNLEDRQLIHDLRVPEQKFLTDLASVTEDAHYIVCIAREPNLHGDQDSLLTFDLKSGQLFRKWNLKPEVSVTCIAMADTSTCVLTQSDGRLLVYSLHEGTCRYEIEGKVRYHNKICLSDDCIVCLTYDSSCVSSTLSMWNINKGELITTFTLDIPPTYCELSADASTIIACLPGHKDIVTLMLHAQNLPAHTVGDESVFGDLTRYGQTFNVNET